MRYGDCPCIGRSYSTLPGSKLTRLWKRLELKFAVRDLLNQSILYKQFSTVTYDDGRTKKLQEITRKYKPGRNIQLTLTYTL